MGDAACHLDSVTRIVLCTGPTMGSARRLYERLGYQRQPDRDWNVNGYELISYGRDVQP